MNYVVAAQHFLLRPQPEHAGCLVQQWQQISPRFTCVNKQEPLAIWAAAAYAAKLWKDWVHRFRRLRQLLIMWSCKSGLKQLSKKAYAQLCTTTFFFFFMKWWTSFVSFISFFFFYRGH